MGYILSVALEGMKGHRVMVEVNVRDEKEDMLSDEQERFIQSNSEASISEAIDYLRIASTIHGYKSAVVVGG